MERMQKEKITQRVERVKEITDFEKRCGFGRTRQHECDWFEKVKNFSDTSFIAVAEFGFAPKFQGYEPRELLLLYPAMTKYYFSVFIFASIDFIHNHIQYTRTNDIMYI